MLQRGAVQDRKSSVAVSRIRQAKPEEALNQPPGELVPADKVEEILHGLDLPATGETEENLAAPQDEDDRGTEEDEEPAEESLSPEDPVRLYLREIGRIHLLNSEQEVRLGQQIERGQERVRRVIMAVPMVRRHLMDLAEQLRKHEVESDQYLEALDGTELTESELRRVQNVFAQIRRLDRELGELEASRNRARKDSTIKAIQAWIAENHQDRVRLLGDLPLKPIVVDRWVGRLRALGQELGGLQKQIETVADKTTKSELRKRARAIEAEVGLPVKRAVSVTRDLDAGEFEVRRREEGPDGGQPAARGLDRQAVPEPRHAAPGPHPGRKHRPHEGGGPVQVSPRDSSSRPMRPGGSARRSRGRSRITRERSGSRCT